MTAPEELLLVLFGLPAKAEAADADRGAVGIWATTSAAVKNFFMSCRPIL